MRVKTAARAALAALLVGAILVPAGTALGATSQAVSQRIFADLADNGRLDGKYTRAQIDRALHSPSLRGYDGPVRQPASTSTPSTAVADGAALSLPFSGLDLALFAAVGGPLLLLGGSLGRVARPRVES